MPLQSCARRLSGVLALPALLLLGACVTSPLQSPGWQAHRNSVTQVTNWHLDGRLNVRQGQESDTVNLNWRQTGDRVSIRLSATLLGLGGVLIDGDDTSVTIEKNGEQPRVLPGLDALGDEYLDYDFPAAYLRWWVRGLPVPSLPATPVLDQNQLLYSLVQTAPHGQRWELTFDRYEQVDAVILPRRIRLLSQDVQLTFLISDWQLSHVEH
jgi:outer membrane lipoprotein LolB